MTLLLYVYISRNYLIIGHITLSKSINCVNIVKIYLSSKVKTLNHMQVFQNRIPTWFIYILSVSVNISLLNLVYIHTKRDITYERQPRMKERKLYYQLWALFQIAQKGSHTLYLLCIIV